MNEELKPCPFCGGEAERHPDYSPYVKCSKCGVAVRFHGTPEMQEAWNNGLVIGISSECRKYEANAWNTRYEPTCKMQRVKRGKYLDEFECQTCYGHTWVPVFARPEYCCHCRAKVEA